MNADSLGQRGVMPIHPSRNLVLRKLKDSFRDAQGAAGALAILDTYGTQSWHRERERVQLAILMQSDGKIDRLRELAGLADRDYRDVLAGAESPEEFQAPPKTTLHEMAEIRQRDRQRYEAWLRHVG